MKLLLLTLLLATVSFAQTISNLVVSVSHGTVYAKWEITATGGASYCAYGATSALGSSTATITSVAYSQLRRWCAFSAVPGSTVYFKPVSNASTWECDAPGTGYTCSDDVATVTLEAQPEVHPVPPTAPAEVNTAYPTINGSDFAVTSCGQLQTQLTACGAADTALNHTVTITAGLSCAQRVTLPAKSGAGTCVVRTSAHALLPPEGTRVTEADLPNMAQLIRPHNFNDGNAHSVFINTNTTAGWRFVGIDFTSESVANHTPRQFTITAVTDAGRMTTSAPHGFITHQMVTVSGVTGFPGRGPNLTAPIAVHNTTEFSYQNSSIACATSSCYAGGGKATQALAHRITSATNATPIVITTETPHGLPVEPWMEITSFTATVTSPRVEATFTFAGSWGAIADGSRRSQMEFRNTPITGLDGILATSTSGLLLTNRWMQTGLNYAQTCASDCGEARFREAISIDGVLGNTAANGAHTFTVLGPNTLQLDDAAGNGAYVSGGAVTFDPGMEPPLLTFAANTSRMILDRSVVRSSGWPTRFLTGMVITGTNTNSAIVDSLVKDFNAWLAVRNGIIQGSLHNYYHHTTTGIDFTNSSYVKFQNNRFENLVGISIFAQEGSSATPVTDITIRGNTFYSDPAYRTGSSTSNGRYYPKRHATEFKQIQRAVIEGNLYDGNWADWTPCGPFIAVSPRGTSTNTGNQGVDVMVRNNIFRNGASVFHVNGQDTYADGVGAGPTKRIVFRNNLLYALDNRVWDASPTADVGGGLCGYTVALNLTTEDVVIDHNTTIDFRGKQGEWLSFIYGTGEGLSVTNNFFTASTDNGGGIVGQNAWQAFGSTPSLTGQYVKFAGANKNATTAGNVVIPTVKNTDSDAHYASTSSTYTWTQSDCNTAMTGFPAGSFTCLSGGTTANARIAAALMQCGSVCLGSAVDPANFRLAPGAPALAAATDKRNAGVDFLALDTAFAVAFNHRISAQAPTAATIRYDMPGAAACQVWYSTSSDPGSGTRISDGGGSRNRSVSIADLIEDTAYFVTVACPANRAALYLPALR